MVNIIICLKSYLQKKMIFNLASSTFSKLAHSNMMENMVNIYLLAVSTAVISHISRLALTMLVNQPVGATAWQRLLLYLSLVIT